GAVVMAFDERDDPARTARGIRVDAVTRNRYEGRGLDNGERYEIVKNFVDEPLLREALGPRARGLAYDDLGRFWAGAWGAAGASERSGGIGMRRCRSWIEASRGFGSTMRRWSGWRPDSAGPRAPCGSATVAISCGATFPTTASCVGTKRRAPSPCSGAPPT